MSSKVNPVILCILDGVGENSQTEFNAVKTAKTPTLSRLLKDNHNSLIRTDGEFVGLPTGQMGNSEVGHTNIGAGRVVFQTLPKINNAIKNQEFPSNIRIKNTIIKAKNLNSTIHIMGLLSNGGVHSHIDHYLAAVKIFAEANLSVVLHLFTDGRDTSPTSAAEFIRTTENFIKQYPTVKIATITGRYFAMDRDHRWERIEAAYNTIVVGEGKQFKSCNEAVTASYKVLEAEGRIASDEFITPSVINNYHGMKNNDIVFMINFRADRAREILTALVEPEFSGFKRKKTIKLGGALGMVSYSCELDNFIETIFPNEDLKDTLSQVVAVLNLCQL